jgi:predicted transposase YdaD
MSVETVLKQVSRDEEQWAKQLFREKAAMDYRSGMGAARDEGLAKGREEGMAMGRSEGIAIGDARGFARARLEYETKAVQDKLEISRKMKARGWLLADIAEDTSLPFDVIEKL